MAHETEKAASSVPLVAMKLDAPLTKPQGAAVAEALKRLRNVHAEKKSKASSWGAGMRGKEAEIPRSVGTMSAMLTAGLFCWDRLIEE
jgi:hypothetical protein